jgi:hypothetical protein
MVKVGECGEGWAGVQPDFGWLKLGDSVECSLGEALCHDAIDSGKGNFAAVCRMKRPCDRC